MQGKGGAAPYSVEAFFLLPAKEGDTATPDKNHYDMRLYIPAALTLREDASMTVVNGKETPTVLTVTTVTFGAGVISQAEEDA